MRRLGFAPQWIRLIMMCVSIVRYSVVVNGEPCGSIAPFRGDHPCESLTLVFSRHGLMTREYIMRVSFCLLRNESELI
jgi:hypothetical protein